MTQDNCHTRKLCYRKDYHATRAIQTDSEALQRYGHLRILGAYGTSFWGKWRPQGSVRTPLERAMVISYRLSIALSVTIQPQFAIKCLRRSNQQGWVTLGPNLGCTPWSRYMKSGSVESEHPRLTNGEIMSDVF